MLVSERYVAGYQEVWASHGNNLVRVQTAGLLEIWDLTFDFVILFRHQYILRWSQWPSNAKINWCSWSLHLRCTASATIEVSRKQRRCLVTADWSLLFVCFASSSLFSTLSTRISDQLSGRTTLNTTTKSWRTCLGLLPPNIWNHTCVCKTI